ncbi:MAG: hypothetical protein HGA93_02260 [Methanothrix sp.]|nr:hypothetical protein [Methanothrix sp.]
MTYSASMRIPDGETVVTRHTGKVPEAVLYPHIFFMFLAMLLSTRAGFEAFRRTALYP